MGHKATKDVKRLTAPEMRGRSARTFGGAIAAAWIEARFREIGLAPAGDHATYFQQFESSQKDGALAMANVVAVLPGDGAETIVIGAHYDHLGHGEPGSLGKAGEIHPGADDNASGVAAMLGAARELKRRGGAGGRRTVVFIAFAGEERGILGSSHFVRATTNRFGKIVAMLNLDMVGRLRNDTLMALGAGSGNEFAALFAEVAAKCCELHVRVSGGGYGPSDHTPFYARGIPVAHFFTGAHTDYHKPSDTADRLNYTGIGKIALFVTEVALRLAKAVKPPTFVRLKDTAPAAGRGYGVYLGTVPRFGTPGPGVEIDGVRTGSPAELAGLKQGDVIRRLGTFKVDTLEDLTRALRSLKPEDTVGVVVERVADGKKTEFLNKVTLKKRGN